MERNENDHVRNREYTTGRISPRSNPTSPRLQRGPKPTVPRKPDLPPRPDPQGFSRPSVPPKPKSSPIKCYVDTDDAHRTELQAQATPVKIQVVTTATLVQNASFEQGVPNAQPLQNSLLAKSHSLDRPDLIKCVEQSRGPPPFIKGDTAGIQTELRQTDHSESTDSSSESTEIMSETFNTIKRRPGTDEFEQSGKPLNEVTETKTRTVNEERSLSGASNESGFISETNSDNKTDFCLRKADTDEDDGEVVMRPKKRFDQNITEDADSSGTLERVISKTASVLGEIKVIVEKTKEESAKCGRPPRLKKDSKKHLGSSKDDLHVMSVQRNQSFTTVETTLRENNIDEKTEEENIRSSYELKPKKPCPPKPKRKLLKVSRSHSDASVVAKSKSSPDSPSEAPKLKRDISKQELKNDWEQLTASLDSSVLCMSQLSPTKEEDQSNPISEVQSETLERLQRKIKHLVPARKAPPPPISKTQGCDKSSSHSNLPLLPSTQNTLVNSDQISSVSHVTMCSSDSALSSSSPYKEVVSVPKSCLSKHSSDPRQIMEDEPDYDYPEDADESQASSSVCPTSLSPRLAHIPSHDNRPLSAESSTNSSQSETGSSSNARLSQHNDSDSHSEYENDDEECKVLRKRDRKLFNIAQEIYSSEAVFVDVLKLINIDFRLAVSNATEKADRPVIPSEVLNKILSGITELQYFNEQLLADLKERVSMWDENRRVADIFVKKGPFLKLYTVYIKTFQDRTVALDDARKRYSLFDAAVKEFELSDRCGKLALTHHMLKPIQRIPQYKMLLEDYLKHLPEESPDYSDTKTALRIVSAVADHANQNMKVEDNLQNLLEVQHCLIGRFEVVRPGRILIKKGELLKQSRKEKQSRMLFLFNDTLLYTTPVTTGYALKHILPLAGMKISTSTADDFQTEFHIISVQRSFTVVARSTEERDEWVNAISSAIEDFLERKKTFKLAQPGSEGPFDKDFRLGDSAPLWVPDSKVTMCSICTSEFTVIWRKHHCRACGRIICSNCSNNQAPLKYMNYRSDRVCDECYDKLKEVYQKEGFHLDPSCTLNPDEGKGGLLDRFRKIRKSGGKTGAKYAVIRPAVLREVAAGTHGSSMSGYLNQFVKAKKWKRFWFVIKDKVLYTYKASEDRAAVESLPLLGYVVKRVPENFEGYPPDIVFSLSHDNTTPHIYRADNANIADKWLLAMQQATVP